MFSYPKAGSQWKYTGMNPGIRHINGSLSMLGNPIMEIVSEEDLQPQERGHIVGLRAIGRDRSLFRYYNADFLRHYVPYAGPASDALAPFQAMLGEALFNGITTEDVHDLLVKVEI